MEWINGRRGTSFSGLCSKGAVIDVFETGNVDSTNTDKKVVGARKKWKGRER